MAGFAPSPTKRNAGQWRKLPKAGRPGPPPAFPLGRMTKAVESLWIELWKSPQAVVWEELGWTRLVARYARKLLEAEKANAPVGIQTEVRQLEDRLGMSPLAMRKNYWVIDDKPTVDEGDDGSGAGGTVTSIDAYLGNAGRT